MGASASSATVLSKQPLQQRFPRQAMMRRHAIQNRCQCANPQRVVVGNGDVMLAVGLAGQPDMASRLP